MNNRKMDYNHEVNRTTTQQELNAGWVAWAERGRGSVWREVVWVIIVADKSGGGGGLLVRGAT